MSSTTNHSPLWSIDNGETWHNGNSRIQLAPGAYTITFRGINGTRGNYASPYPMNITITAGQTATFNEKYIRMPKTLTVTTSTGNHGGTYTQYNTTGTIDQHYWIMENSLYGGIYYLYYIQDNDSHYYWAIGPSRNGQNIIAYATTTPSYPPSHQYVSWVNVGGGTITVEEPSND